MKHLCAPMFKGVIKTDDPMALELVTGKNRGTGTPIEREQYLELVKDGWLQQPLVVQNVVRGAAAALLSYGNDHRRYEWQNEPTHLIAVEGCEHIVGGKPMSGGQIMESIWQNVVPPEVMSGIPGVIIRHISRCTLEEAKAVLAELDEKGTADVISHEYHLKRTQLIFTEEALADQKTQFFTPDEAASRARWHLREQDFLNDIVKSREAHWYEVQAMERKEGRAEWLNGKLHALRTPVRLLSLDMVDPEITLAGILRKRYKPAKTES